MTTIALTSPRPATAAAAGPMPLRRVLGAYAAESWFETKRHLKAPAFALPFLVIPVALYMFFTNLGGDPSQAPKPELQMPIRMFTGFSIMGVMGPALFSFGMAVAVDRDFGLLRLKRALPMPPMAYMMGKMVMASLFSAAVMLSMTIPAIVKGLPLSAGQYLAVAAIGIVGTLPFAAIGLFIGAKVSGRTAPAWVNLAYIPMTYLSGLFFPVPEAIRVLALASPAFHLNQLALQAAGVAGLMPATMHAAALLGVTVLFAGLAAWRVSRMG
jgi:ABC-2 type transport system permease protein